MIEAVIGEIPVHSKYIFRPAPRLEGEMSGGGDFGGCEVGAIEFEWVRRVQFMGFRTSHYLKIISKT